MDHRPRGLEINHPPSVELLLGALDALADVRVDERQHLLHRPVLVPSQANRRAHNSSQDLQARKAHSASVQRARSDQHFLELLRRRRAGPIRRGGEHAGRVWHLIGVRAQQALSCRGCERLGGGWRTRGQHAPHDCTEAGETQPSEVSDIRMYAETWTYSSRLALAMSVSTMRFLCKRLSNGSRLLWETWAALTHVPRQGERLPSLRDLTRRRCSRPRLASLCPGLAESW